MNGYPHFKSYSEAAFFDYRLNRFLLLISGLTIFIAWLGPNFECDLKKIIYWFYIYYFLNITVSDVYAVSYTLAL